MYISQLFRRLRNRQVSKQADKPLPKRNRFQLAVERLEQRDLLAAVPVITSVTPVDFSILNQITTPTIQITPPAIKITYNENVVGGNVASNFALIDSSGDSVVI